MMNASNWCGGSGDESPRRTPHSDPGSYWKAQLGRQIPKFTRRLEIPLPTVGKRWGRFIAKRPDGLVEGASTELSRSSCTSKASTPENATHWSQASAAEESELSKSTVGRIWKTFGLKPDLGEDVRLSNDSLLTEKIYNAVGLHFPPEAAVVLSIDGKS
jgi:hypothetical protein